MAKKFPTRKIRAGAKLGVEFGEVFDMIVEGAERDPLHGVSKITVEMGGEETVIYDKKDSSGMGQSLHGARKVGGEDEYLSQTASWCGDRKS